MPLPYRPNFYTLVLFFFCILQKVAGQTDSSGFGRIGTFDLFATSDFRLNTIIYRGDYATFPVGHRARRYYAGGTIVIRQSFLATALLRQQQGHWRYGDWVHGELTVGHHNADFPEAKRTPIFPLYAFELGLFGSYAPSTNTDISFVIALFRFTRDFMSQRTPGSAYYFRLAYARMLLELGWITENKLYFGTFNKLVDGSNQVKVQCSAKYRFEKWKYVGLQISYFPLFGPIETPFGNERIHTLQIGYGINF